MTNDRDRAAQSSAHPTLWFLGAAGTVTGSEFLLATPRTRVLVDCGLFQGDRKWRRRNWEDLVFDPGSVDAVVLTHAHLDHSGALPLLTRRGFSGPVLCTPATARLAAIVLRDAAHLQEDEAHYANEAGFSKHAPALPLFDAADAEKAISLLRPLGHERGTLPGGMTLHMRRAGHILGSAFAEIEADGTRVVFSGDMGRAEHPLLPPPSAPADADADVVVVVVVRRPRARGLRRRRPRGRDPAYDAPRRRVPAACLRGGPHRVLLMVLARLKGAGQIPDLPIYVDSPMALQALEVYRDAIARHDPDVRPEIGTSGHLCEPPGLRLMPTREDSEKLNRPGHPCIIISASGMATGGRVLHHLAHQLPSSLNTVVLTGFQVPGTRGHALEDGASSLKIHGRYVPVRAEVVSLHGYSAHADAGQLVAWLSAMRTPRTAYVVHGEPDALNGLAVRLRTELGWETVVPAYLEKVRRD